MSDGGAEMRASLLFAMDGFFGEVKINFPYTRDLPTLPIGGWGRVPVTMESTRRDPGYFDIRVAFGRPRAPWAIGRFSYNSPVMQRVREIYRIPVCGRYMQNLAQYA